MQFKKLRSRLGKSANTALDYLGRPNAAIKRGALDFAKSGSISGALGAAGDQLGQPSDEAPSGYEVAEALGQRYDIESPEALTALSVAAEMADVPVLGTATKGLRMAAKGAKKVPYKMAYPEEFYKVISDVRANPNPLYKANITEYSPKDYEDFRTFLSPDKKSGYAVKPDGELISVFSLERGRNEALVDDAILNKGATKLDAFDIEGKLSDLYGKYMDETDRLKFADEYAPKDWDFDAMGRPDVVQMRLNPEKVKKAQGFGTFGKTLTPDIDKYNEEKKFNKIIENLYRRIKD